MKLKIIPILIVLFTLILNSSGLLVGAASNSNLIDDAVFDSKNTMSAAQIDTFLNGFAGSCLSTNNGFSAVAPAGYTPSGGYTYGGPVSAGQVIYNAAQAYELNPQVLISTLQKEEGLIRGDGAYGCSALALSASMGYGCPDSGSLYNYSGLSPAMYYSHGTPVTAINGTCVNGALKAGFSQQVIRAAWLLSFGRHRAEGQSNWAIIKAGWDNTDDLATCYGGPMTQGNFKRCPTDASPTYYDGYATISGQSIHIDNGATAALYWYTPHLQSFSTIFQTWFGNPTTPCFAVGNVTGATSGRGFASIRYPQSASPSIAFTQLNNTGSSCAETHVWNSNYQAWQAHIATGMKATDPALGQLVSNRSGIDQQDSLNLILYNGGGGNVEVHRIKPGLQSFPGYYDVATNLSGVSSATGTFVSGDFLGLGYQQMAYVLYSGSGGKVEVHLFDKSLQKAVGYYDVATNLSGVTSTTGTFVAGDFLGRGYQQLAYVLYSGSGGKVEVHLFDKSLQKAVGFYDVATNLGGITATTGTFVAGDFLGRGYEQMNYILYSGSTGKVEVHTFNRALTQAIGFQDIATNLPAFDPAQ